MSMRTSFAAAAVAIVAPLAALALPPPPPAAPDAGLLLRVADGTQKPLLAPLRGATTGTMTQGGGSGSTVVYAAIDLKCGDSTITVSTGNKKGSCGQTTVGGADYTKCSDGKGNYAYANCAEGCTQSGGSGSCTMKAATDPGGGTTPPKPGKPLLGELRAVTSGVMAPPSHGTTTVVYATISLKCSDGIYTVSTGNSSGACITTPPGGNRSGSCQDNKGNGATASCAKGCESSSGAGSCTFKAPQ